jgi:hypothetical protein
VLYFWVTLPSVILSAAGLLLGVFPLEQTSKAARWRIAAVLVTIAVISGIVSAIQTRAQDSEIANLSSQESHGINDVRGDISALKEQTPRIPRLQVHSSAQVSIQQTTPNQFSFAAGLTVTNDGDDLVFTNHYLVEGGLTTTDFGRKLKFAEMRRKLPDLGLTPVNLNYGADKTIWLYYLGPLNGANIDELTNRNLLTNKMTMYFVERFDAHTSTGLRKTLWFCAFYVAGSFNVCRDNSL